MSRLLVAQRALTVPGWAKDALWRRAQAIPSLDLRFADNKSLVDAVTGASLITFTRASSGTYVGSDGVLRSAVTNLLLRSEEFNDAGVWAKVGTTVSTNSITSPNGALTADTLVEDTSTGTHRCVAAPTIANTTVCTVSVYAKTAGRTHMRLSVSGGLAGELTANLSNGTVAASSGATNPTVQSVGDGWYRVSFTTAASTGTSAQITLSCIQGTSTSSYTGDGTSGVYLWGAQLEQSATVGEYIPTTNAINSAPRFDHNPTIGESLGLLVEEPRTNLLLWSEEFDNAVWAKQTATITANESTAPNGTTTADLVTSTATIGAVSQTYTKDTTARTYTQTSWVKSDTSLYSASIDDGTVTNRGRCTFDISTGALTGVFNEGSFTNTSGSITSFRDSWYRVRVTTTTSTGITIRLRNTTSTVAGETVRVWGFQLEEGAFPTSYIPTTTAAATRSADVASITGTAFSGWYRQDEGTMFAQGSTSASASNPILFQVEDGTANERIQIRRIGATNLASSIVSDGGVNQGGPTSAGFNADTIGKVGFSYALNNLQLAFNGALGTADTSATLPTVDRAFIGSASSPVYANGRISRITYWPQALPSRLQALTQ